MLARRSAASSQLNKTSYQSRCFFGSGPDVRDARESETAEWRDKAVLV